jgi:hypothetical protein
MLLYNSICVSLYRNLSNCNNIMYLYIRCKCIVHVANKSYEHTKNAHKIHVFHIQSFLSIKVHLEPFITVPVHTYRNSAKLRFLYKYGAYSSCTYTYILRVLNLYFCQANNTRIHLVQYTSMKMLRWF